MTTNTYIATAAVVLLIGGAVYLTQFHGESSGPEPQIMQKPDTAPSVSPDPDKAAGGGKAEPFAPKPAAPTAGAPPAPADAPAIDPTTQPSPAAGTEAAPGLPDPMDELAHERNEMFKLEALETFPLHTVESYDPLVIEKGGPPEGEVWIRIKAENAAEFKDIMAQVADLYKSVAREDRPITVMHWVGGRPHARFQYPPPEDALPAPPPAGGEAGEKGEAEL